MKNQRQRSLPQAAPGQANKRSGTAGMTLVELVITFALLAFFMTMAVSVLVPFYATHQKMEEVLQAQDVADAVLESVRAQVSDADSYIKLRTSAGASVDCEGKYTGDIIEYAARNGYIVRIDSLEIPEESPLYLKRKNKITGSFTNPPGYLAIKYYQIEGESDKGYTDEVDYEPGGDITGETEGLVNGTYAVAREAERVFAERTYMGLTADLRFAVPEGAIRDDGSLRYINVGVILYRMEDGERVKKYEDWTAVYLVNEPKYEEGPTAGTEMPESETLN